MSKALATARGGQIVAADYSLGMLAVARHRLQSPTLRCDAFALPLRDESFDHVLTLRLVFHYSDPAPILAEATRVLRPGGEIVFDTLNPLSSRRLAEWILRLMGRRRGKPGLCFLPRRAVRTTAASLGLEVVDCESRFLLPTRLYRVVPRFLHAPLLLLERVVPSPFRVLTYWRAVKRA